MLSNLIYIEKMVNDGCQTFEKEAQTTRMIQMVRRSKSRQWISILGLPADVLIYTDQWIELRYGLHETPVQQPCACVSQECRQ